MPTIDVSKKDLEKLVKKKFDLSSLEYLKASFSADEKNSDLLHVELKDVNRPDLWSTEGIARELKSHLGFTKGIPKYSFLEQKQHYVVNVANKVKKVRPPIIACAVVLNLKLDDNAIFQLIQLQEKLCESFGRKRKEASMGVYDFDKIKWPITYTTFKPNELKFIPLGMNEEMTLKDILLKHEKGKQYGHLIEKSDEYPVILDSSNNVLSMPPVINSEYTGKVTSDTKNVFIEVTGTSERFVLPVLNIMVSALAERGGDIVKVRIKKGKIMKKEHITPDFTPAEFRININSVNDCLGLNLNAKEMDDLLEKSGFNVKKKEKDFIIIEVPSWRQDVMSETDIIEDIAINYGYSNFDTEMPKIPTIGKTTDLNNFIKKISNLLTGLGSQEIATFSLTNKDVIFKNMRAKPEQVVEISNPISLNYSCLRISILPSVIEWLSSNKDARYGQNVFEIGSAIKIENSEAVEKTKLCFAISDTKTNFTDIKKVLDWLFSCLGLNCRINQKDFDCFIEGRAGEIIVSKNAGAKSKTLSECHLGSVGEIHPAVLEKFNIVMPIAAFELDLSELMSALKL